MSKKKTLVVSYLPSGQSSNTKLILDHFMSTIKKVNTDVEHIDLLKIQIPDFTSESMGAYHLRNFMGKELNHAQQKSMAEMDTLAKQFKEADIIVLAFPMHNFSYPGVVKSYIDCVMLKGMVFDYVPTGLLGLMKGKKGLAIYTAASGYDEARASWDMCGQLFINQCTFMSFDEVKAVKAYYTSQPDKKDASIKAANEEITEIVKKWY